MTPLGAYPAVLTTMAKSCINKTLFQIIITNLTLLRKMKDFSKNYYKNSKNARNWQLCWWNKKHRWTNQHSSAHTPKETCKRALWKVVFHQINPWFRNSVLVLLFMLLPIQDLWLTLKNKCMKIHPTSSIWFIKNKWVWDRLLTLIKLGGLNLTPIEKVRKEGITLSIWRIKMP